MTNHNKVLWLWGGKCKEELEILLSHSGMNILKWTPSQGQFFL